MTSGLPAAEQTGRPARSIPFGITAIASGACDALPREEADGRGRIGDDTVCEAVREPFEPASRWRMSHVGEATAAAGHAQWNARKRRAGEAEDVVKQASRVDHRQLVAAAPCRKTPAERQRSVDA